MPTASKSATNKVLAYIDSLPEWSAAICAKLRQIILEADVSIVEEWKWGPNYGSNGMVCGFGAFQKHVKFTFLNGSAMKDAKGLFNHCVENEFNRSIKFTQVNEIDADILTAYIKESIVINQKGFKRVVKDRTVEVPTVLLQALSAHPKAAAFFDGLTYGYKKDFAEHVTTAKQEKTRLQRIAKIVSLCAEEKTLNHKYKPQIKGVNKD
jgi:hypothetical protein